VQKFLHRLVALEELGLKGALPVAGHLQRERSYSRGELALVTPVAPTAALVGTLARFGSEMLGHLRL
jgi:Flp pilus assembly secretin CpaC